MAVVASVTIGTANYTVYGLTSNPVADAKSYFAGSVNAALWAAMSTDEQKRGMISAFRALERLKYEGNKSGSPQSTKFPRDGLTDCEDEALADSTTPDEIAMAEFELALLLHQDPTLLAAKSTRSDVRRAKADTAEVEFFLAPAGEETRMPTVVHDLISCFLSGTASEVGLPFASGTDVESSFDEEDMDRSDGFA